jgi:hypothetical protein
METIRVVHCACGQTGQAVWEETPGREQLGPASIPVTVSDGFWIQVSKKQHGSNRIVCGLCGQICAG